MCFTTLIYMKPQENGANRRRKRASEWGVSISPSHSCKLVSEAFLDRYNSYDPGFKDKHIDGIKQGYFFLRLSKTPI